MRLLSDDVRRLAAIGAALAAGVLAAGFAIEIARFGRSDADAFARVEAGVRRDLEAMSDELRARAAVVAADAGRIARAARGDQPSANELFTVIEAAHTRHDDRVALTVYGPSSDDRARAIAWSDGPAEDLPVDRVEGPEALFAADGTLGLRLVYLIPVQAEDGTRAGAVAVERILVPARGVARGTPRRVLDTPLAPVRLLTRYEGAGETAGPMTFVVHARTGEVLLQGQVEPHALADARARFRRGVIAITAVLLALFLAAFTGPILDARQHAWNAKRSLALTLLALAVIAAARVSLRFAVPPHWKAGPGFDVFATGAMLLAMAAIVAPLIGQLPIALRRRGRLYASGSLVPFVASAIATAAVGQYASVLSRLSNNRAIDLLDFSLYPLSAERLFLSLGLILLAAATLWAAVLLLLASDHIRRQSAYALTRPLMVSAWLVPPALALLAESLRRSPSGKPNVQVFAALAAAAAAALLAPRARRYYAHASHATRLLAIWLLLILPALALYPLSIYYADRATRETIEREYAPRTAGHTGELQDQLSTSLERIDAIANLPALVETGAGQGPQAAFFVWDSTPLGDSRLTSAVELYGADGTLASRFALNLPEVDAISQRTASTNCRQWDVFGEVNRFGSEERRMLHAERALCDAAGAPRGTIVIHVMPDYRALPFIAAANPYLEVLRGAESARRPGAEEVQVAIYGWGLLPLFTSSPWAWQILPDTFDRLYQSREPFWTRMTGDDRAWHVYLRNDRAGIYAIGYPALTAFDVLVHGAEIATLAGMAWLLILAGAAAFLPLARRRMNVGRVLLREIRTSFYRKLLLAFVAASIVPVIVLALVLRAYTAGLLREDVEEEAARTVAVAQRSIENYAAQERPGLDITDNLMVQLSQILSQDINLFDGPRLIATSARDLFASGLLPTRTPAQVYRKVALERLTSFVGEEQIGSFPYLLAATPARTGGRDVILSVPLLTRRSEIEREIAELERGIHLAAVLFILLGSALGLYMAERIADPVRRLTRATRRIASGDFDARVAIRTADELRRLVDDFNQMGEELKAQRDELKRSQRLAAWAEMARQVAHEIKNPLTPIQLSAEHLRRVHADRGEPMSPVLNQCVDSILTQVKLLRQISSEFSAFASSPTVRPIEFDAGELVGEIVAPYRAGLPERIEMTLDIARDLPKVRADRTLLGRALTNLIENGLHAMPEGGRLSVAVAHEDHHVTIRVSDTGVGMDAEALERAFEPYFSTKATGTGLGLPIAKRNVELNGGSIAIESERGRGTAVTVRMPAASA